MGDRGRFRRPEPAAAVPATVKRRPSRTGGRVQYHAYDIQAGAGGGWTGTPSGPGEVTGGPDEADTRYLRRHPKSVTGFRLARAED